MKITKFQLKSNSIIIFFLPIFILILNSSCREDEFKVNKYDRPEWLVGKLFTQLLDETDLSTFAKCIELTGYDTIIDVSGSYTIFAPTNEAFDTWLANNPDYSSVEDIPVPTLTRLVKYHIIQDAWTTVQLRTLDVFGWIDSLDVNNDKPKGFKRETLLKEPDRWVGYKSLNRNQVAIVDTLQTPNRRRIITDSRKYVPFFYQEYFNIYDLSPEDYAFYFSRPFEGGENLYVANGKMVSKEIFAENGFIYKIDQVIKPLQNSYEILESGNGSDNYSKYLSLLNEFPEFQYNASATFDQEGADQGLEIDSLFNLTYPDLVFDLNSEKTQPPSGTYGLPSNVTIRYHHGLIAPTDNAFNQLVNEYIKIPGGWGDLEGAPLNIKRIIANTHMSINSVYPTDFKNGFYNGEDDIVTLNEDQIIHKEFGSNCTFIGLNKAIVPRAFSSVTGAIYLQQGYAKIMYAIERANLLPLLKRRNQNYMFFVEPDLNTSDDSSLVYNSINNSFATFQLPEEPGGQATRFSLTVNDLRGLLFSHIASARPKGNATIEFVPNLRGGFLIINNETGEVSGTAPTTAGYMGSTEVPEFPIAISEADNGTTYKINNWFSFSSPSLFSLISTRFPKFHALMKKAGFSVDKEFRYSFISNSEYYTVFIPSAAAIDSSELNSLPVDELRKALLFHFVQGSLIFTDGNKNAGYYETTRVDEKSTPYSTVYSKLFVETGIDVIRFKNKEGGIYAEINQASDNTNLLTGIIEGTDVIYPNVFNNAVIHEINKVLTFEEVDTN